MKKYYVGIDIGGTKIKAAIHDAVGNCIICKGSGITLHVPKPRFTERDMEELWKLIEKLIKSAIEESGISPEDIKAVACTGHGKGLFLWGKDNKPVRNGIVSTDSRAVNYVEKWYADGTNKKVYERSSQEILASQPCALLAWLKDNEPESYANIQWVFEVKDYVRFRLTGKAHAEYTDYSGTNLMNLHTKEFDKELLRLFGIEEMYDKLPPLINSFENGGTITAAVAAETGLKEGTPVAGGMFDIDACAIASGVTNEDDLCVIVGTWGINEYISRKPVLNGTIKMNSLYCIPEYYLIEESSPSSASNLEWCIQNLLFEGTKMPPKDIYKILNENAASVNPAETELLFLPYLFGSGDDPEATASFIGLGNYHSKKHIVYAIYEGVVFSHLHHIRRLLKAHGEFNAICLAGGAANSTVWAQMFANICNMPIKLKPVSELGTLGCAMACAVMTGEYADIHEAAEKMVPSGATLMPQPEQYDIYMQKFEKFEQLTEILSKK